MTQIHRFTSLFYICHPVLYVWIDVLVLLAGDLHCIISLYGQMDSDVVALACTCRAVSCCVTVRKLYTWSLTESLGIRSLIMAEELNLLNMC